MNFLVDISKASVCSLENFKFYLGLYRDTDLNLQIWVVEKYNNNNFLTPTPSPMFLSEYKSYSDTLNMASTTQRADMIYMSYQNSIEYDT